MTLRAVASSKSFPLPVTLPRSRRQRPRRRPGPNPATRQLPRRSLFLRRERAGSRHPATGLPPCTGAELCCGRPREGQPRLLHQPDRLLDQATPHIGGPPAPRNSRAGSPAVSPSPVAPRLRGLPGAAVLPAAVGLVRRRCEGSSIRRWAPRARSCVPLGRRLRRSPTMARRTPTAPSTRRPDVLRSKAVVLTVWTSVHETARAARLALPEDVIEDAAEHSEKRAGGHRSCAPVSAVAGVESRRTRQRSSSQVTGKTRSEARSASTRASASGRAEPKMSCIGGSVTKAS
jgi:hypothetical protein